MFARLFLPVYLIGMILFVGFLMFGCATTAAVRTNPSDYGAIAQAGCSDVRNMQFVTETAVAWTRAYFPNREKFFVEKIDPIMLEVAGAVDVYCQMAEVVKDADTWSNMLEQRDELVSLIAKVTALIRQIKSSRG